MTRSSLRCVSTCLASLLLLVGGAIAAESVDLTPWADLGSGPLAVEASLRFAGSVTAEGAADAVPTRGDYRLAYVQEELPDSGPQPVFARRVDQSAAALRDDARLLLARPGERGAKITAASGPLTRGELDLVQLAADPLDIDGLLPLGNVRDGGTWKVPSGAVERLLRLKKGEVCEVVGVVSDITSTHARLRFAGPVHGEVDGARVEIDLRGVALFDRQLGRVSRLNLAWKESRAVGPATPAVEAIAKLNVTIDPADEEERLGADLLSQAAAASSDDRLLVTAGGGAWTLLAGRDWFVVADDHQATTLRRVEGGQVAAVTTLASTPQRKLPLGQFEREVRYALGEGLQQVVKSQETPDDKGVRRLMVASVGKAEEQPVEWRHHHLAGPHEALAATTTLPVADGKADDAAVRRLVESIRPASAPSETADARAPAVRR
ncbi:hypothetical protein Pla108_24000 [Botrimarina colliarenosi]|uniref:Uncharacterized protein n=1 Tax=Botrimarina colliarenosi TaxID=2528001 RepID=A0A5C6AC35_9BACT|nr:hypothetical protein [Botrimarina colliarenosi]TWT96631.1 hypothetical protein Pla108_24000 [Botrimarina colliarenosi]